MPPIEVARRYYHDSYATTFDARVVERTTHEGRPAVVLETTAFYPTSGGQPHDTGTIGTARVLDVVVREADGAVLQVLDGPLTDDHAPARVDWARRFDHMQQHTGQHVLSQAFIRVADAATIGFHLGQDYVSIDLDSQRIDDAIRDEAFAMANGVISRDLPIRAWFPTVEELAGITLRKTPEVTGALRIVAIGDFDVSACGGTHVARTGEVGLVHCLKVERLKRGARVSFLAGDRARRDYQDKQRIVSQLSAALTCSVPELPAALARIQDELQAARRELGRQLEEALDREAGRLREGITGSPAIVRCSWQGRPVEEVRGLALRLTAQPGVIALLATGGERTQFIFARSEEVVANLKEALDQALALVGGGKGGGARVVQGGGAAVDAATLDRALDAASAAVSGR